MESNFDCPNLEIVCGGSQDEQSHEVAYQGIKQFIGCDSISLCEQQQTVYLSSNGVHLDIIISQNQLIPAFFLAFSSYKY